MRTWYGDNSRGCYPRIGRTSDNDDGCTSSLCIQYTISADTDTQTQFPRSPLPNTFPFSGQIPTVQFPNQSPFSGQPLIIPFQQLQPIQFPNQFPFNFNGQTLTIPR